MLICLIWFRFAYVRVPKPADYFLLSVRTNESAIESETANPDNALESEASKPNQADQHTSSSQFSNDLNVHHF
jgi:hypothetical protein